MVMEEEANFMVDSRDDQSVIDLTKVDPGANQQTGATLPDPPQVVIEDVQSDDFDSSTYSKRFVSSNSLGDELIDVNSVPSSGDHGSMTLWQKPSVVSKEEVVSPRRLKVLEKARAALASTKADEIKQHSEERAAAAQAREEIEVSDESESKDESKSSEKDQEITPEKKFYKEISKRLLDSDTSETEKKTPDPPKVFNFADLEPSSDESCVAAKKKEAIATSLSQTGHDSEKSVKAQNTSIEQAESKAINEIAPEKTVQSEGGTSHATETSKRVNAVLGTIEDVLTTRPFGSDEAKSAKTKEEKEKSSAFARLRETLKQLDVTGANGPKRRKEKKHRKVKRKHELPTKPILSNYSQDAAVADGEDTPDLEKKIQGGRKDAAISDASNEVPIGAHRGILKNAKEESRVRFGFFQSGDPKMDQGTATTEPTTTVDQATPKHSNSNAIESSEKSVHSQTGARSVDNTSRSAYESDAHTYGDDTESKVSLVSYLGSEDSDLETNFESSTVPMLVKMLDKGCAWLESNNCGVEAPSLLKESNNKPQVGINAKTSLLAQSTKTQGTTLNKKPQLFAPITGETRNTEDYTKAATPKSENQKSNNNLPTAHLNVNGEVPSSDPETSEKTNPPSGHDPAQPTVDDDTFEVRNKGNQNKSMANILHETSRIERMRAAANSDIWRRPTTGPNVGSHLKAPTPLHYEHSITEIQSAEGYEIQPETAMPVFESQYHAPKSNNGSYILDPVGQNISDFQREDLEANSGIPSQSYENNSDPPDEVLQKLPDPDSDHEGLTESVHRPSQDYGTRMCMDPQEIISPEEEGNDKNSSEKATELQEDVQLQEQEQEDEESNPMRLSVDPEPEKPEEAPELIRSPDSATSSGSFVQRASSRSQRSSKGGRSKSAPRAGGPEEASGRRQILNEAPLHIDSEMFMGLTDDERLAALKLAEKLRSRAEKLKRRKKREKKLKRIRSG